jgi:glycerate kinase
MNTLVAPNSMKGSLNAFDFADTVEKALFVSGKTAIIEMAEAWGMKLVKTGELNPLKATSIGTSELIEDALLKESNKKVREF